MKDVAELSVRDDGRFYFLVWDYFIGDDDVLEFGLDRERCTLQMGQELFLLITRIL